MDTPDGDAEKTAPGLLQPAAVVTQLWCLTTGFVPSRCTVLANKYLITTQVQLEIQQRTAI